MEEALLHGMEAGKQREQKTNMEKDMTDIFGRMEAANRITDDTHRFFKEIFLQ